MMKGTDFFVLGVSYGEMKIEGFERIAQIDEVTPVRPKRVTVGGREIVLLCAGKEIFAVENLCPHQHYSVFHQSILNGYTLVCPIHGWSFDVRTGKNILGNGRIKVFEVRLEKNEVWVKFPEENSSFHLAKE